MATIHNFNPGPCELPSEVLQEAAEGILNYQDSGLSILTMSHRSKEFIAVMEEARELVRELLDVPDTHTVLYLQGGASLGFLMTPYNFLTEKGTAGYVNTGTWASNAIKEAKRIGNVEVLASSEEKNFNFIPKGFAIPEHLDYVHFTSNNTIFGTQYKELPSSSVPVICDMSSDIFSREVDVSKFAMIYAGAQKNMGPAGTTLFIVQKDLFGKSGRNIPAILDLSVHENKESMFNTPPCFAVYASMLTLRWLKNAGGVDFIETINQRKADLLYSEIDANPLFEGTAAREDRSNMNATFIMKDESHKDEFDAMWKETGIIGIKGHRSVGGYRASMYNALKLESVQALVEVMHEFAKKYS